MKLNNVRALSLAASALALGCLPACVGDISSSTSPSPTPSAVSVQVSGTSPLSTSCGTTVPAGTTETFTLGSGIQPQIAAVPSTAVPNTTVVGVWEQDRWNGLGSRAILTSRSTDSGTTWGTPIILPFSNCGSAGLGASYDRVSDPWVSFGASGVVLASALAFSANGYTACCGFSTTGGPSAVLVSRSTDSGATWSAPVAVRVDANTGAGPFYFNDRDSITADPLTGNVYVVWDQLGSTGVGTPAYLALSKDNGVTWNSGILYNPGAGAEAFNNEIAVLPSGTVLDFFTLLAPTGGSTLQVLTLTITGTSWSVSTPVTVATINSVGTPDPIASVPLIRDSSRMAQIAVDPKSGAVAAVWQQQSSGSTTFDGIALSVSTNSGATWSAPKQINGLNTAAAFSPTVRYLPNSVLAVTYYDLRDYVSGSSVLNTTAWLTESSDGGATWHELRLQSPFDLNQAPLADSTAAGFGTTALFLGDNQGLALVGSSPVPLPFYAATSSTGAHAYATQPLDPLKSSSAHVYEGVRAGAPAAAVVERAQAAADRARLRGAASAGTP